MYGHACRSADPPTGRTVLQKAMSSQEVRHLLLGRGRVAGKNRR